MMRLKLNGVGPWVVGWVWTLETNISLLTESTVPGP